MNTKKCEKGGNQFKCEKCDYNACDKYNLNRHLLTLKHIKHVNHTKNEANEANEAKKRKNEANHIIEKNDMNEIISYGCSACERKYKHKNNLYAHKKKCTYINNNINNEKHKNIEIANNGINNFMQNLFVQLIQENKEFKNMLIENQKQVTTLIPKIGNNNNNNNTINNTQNNNKFNINVFLNEQCKDAMSMNEFIDSIEISMQDLIKTKDEGFASGISNIFIKGMSKLSPYQRPLHCTDVKRETLYVKNEKWEKDVTKEKITDAIKSVSAKQFKHINNYKDANPDFMQNDKKREEYFNILKNTTEPIENNSNKIIKNICPTIYVKENDKELIET
jgi:hypothetical protein